MIGCNHEYTKESGPTCVRCGSVNITRKAELLEATVCDLKDRVRELEDIIAESWCMDTHCGIWKRTLKEAE